MAPAAKMITSGLFSFFRPQNSVQLLCSSPALVMKPVWRTLRDDPLFPTEMIESSLFCQHKRNLGGEILWEPRFP